MIPDKYPLLKGRGFKFIDKVGLELEGGWETAPQNVRIYGDGSVRCRGSHKGETRTDPKSTVEEIFSEMDRKYPEDIDQTCGMHIHTSIKSGMFHRVADKEFFDYFLLRMGNLAKYLRHAGNDTDYKRFLARLNGSNEYCSRDFKPREQLSGNWERRTMINFRSYSEHGTFECRLMPMFEEFKSAKMATHEYIDCVETYLASKELEAPIEVIINEPECDDHVTSEEAICA